ncbi:MAG: VWA domain-containing protein [Acidobacteria bacterium]|nr:VWA domain-containing protein [Acidobacteriota bacterium]MBP7473937.1 VWA domain-containing protein [Pyrinomonadaceae bacterium]
MRSIFHGHRRLFAVASLILLFSIGGSAQSGRVTATPTPTPVDEVLRVNTEEIKLNVLAFDEEGKFFRDVTDRDLVISENNVLHQPTSVRRLPANVLIVLDTGGEMRAVKSLDQTRKVARGVVEALQPDDSIAVMSYADKAEIIGEWTTDKAQALAAIKRTTFGRRSVFVDAITLATEFLLKDPLENKHLVLITDGTDSQGRSSAKFDAMQRLLATDISVHVLSYTEMEAADIEPRTKGISNMPPPKSMPDEIADTLPNGARDIKKAPKIGPTISLDRTFIKKMKARKAELEVSQEQLDKLAEESNGSFILPATIDEMLEKSALVAKMIDASYVVTYTPKIPVVETRGIAERKIDVTSKRPGLVVQARRKLMIARAK